MMYAVPSQDHKQKAAAEAEWRRRRGQSSAATPAPTFRGDNQRAAKDITDRAWVIAGPAETGKTWATLWRLDAELRKPEHAGAQAALVRKVRATMDGTVLVTYRRVLERSGSGARVFGGSKPQWFDYPNGARLWIGGMDDPTKILSGERDFIYINQAEDLEQADWETLSTRATGRGAVTKTPMLFGDCNPGPGDHWILRRRDAGLLTLLESRHEDNPTLFDEDGVMTAQGRLTIATLDGLSGARKQRLRYGRWVGAEGQYFEAWNDTLHTCKPFPIPNDWPIWGALDQGFIHPTAFGLFTRDSDGTVYMIGEHVQHKWLPAQHAIAMHHLRERLGIIRARIRVTVAGHDVFAQRGDSAGLTLADQYAQAGWELARASIDRIQGANELLRRLGNPQALQPISLRIFTTCPRTIATMPRMVHDPHRPEDVLKVDADADGMGGDDPYDMLRYGVMEAADSGWGKKELGAFSSGRRV